MSPVTLSPTQLLSFIESRQSIGQLVAPAPSQAELAQAVQAAIAAPDHHRLRPWRFIKIEGDDRHRLGQLFCTVLQEEGADKAQLERTLAQPLRAPLILMCVVNTRVHPKVPVVEQVLSMGAAIQNLLLMLHAQGYVGMWRTGALAESARLKSELGLKIDDEIAGFIYIGSASKTPSPREPLAVSSFLQQSL